MSATKEKKAPPVAGHKCRGALMWVSVSCECGWGSTQFRGEGARASAYGEWRKHVAKCQEVKS